MLIDMDLSGAFFFLRFSFPYNVGETKNVMIFPSSMVLFDAFFYVFYEMAFLGSFSLQGVFSSNFGRFIFTIFFFRTWDGVWKFALNMCILGFSFSHSLLIL